MIASIVAVGDELLIGQVVNTNASWLGERLTALGWTVHEQRVVGDDEAQLVEVFKQVSHRSNLTVICGGLGPTHDDRTRSAIASAFDAPLVFDNETWSTIQERFARRKRQAAPTNRVQAYVPTGWRTIPNAHGTAPGLWFEERHSDDSIRLLVVLPGVPFELKAMWTSVVEPHLLASIPTPAIVQKTILTAGIGESDLQVVLNGLEALVSNEVTLAFLPGTQGVRLRLTGRGDSTDAAEQSVASLSAFIHSRARKFIYSEVAGDSLAAHVGRSLLHHGQTIALAESCTGGGISSALTDIPGASAYVIGAVVAYCNSVKHQFLEVNSVDLDRHGAVSEPVAIQMAQSIRRQFDTTLGLSVTGIMGPGGGTPDKPVGTIWLALAYDGGYQTKLLHLAHDRQTSKEITIAAALNLVRTYLDGLTNEVYQMSASTSRASDPNR